MKKLSRPAREGLDITAGDITDNERGPNEHKLEQQNQDQKMAPMGAWLVERGVVRSGPGSHFLVAMFNLEE